jgi:hypothetical protein
MTQCPSKGWIHGSCAVTVTQLQALAFESISVTVQNQLNHTCHLSYAGGVNKEASPPGRQAINARPFLKNN